MIHHAVDQQIVFLRVDVGRLEAVRNREVKRGSRSDTIDTRIACKRTISRIYNLLKNSKVSETPIEESVWSSSSDPL